ncbi:MAG: hypothetical protein ACRDRW_05685 [Pseudonocardiaceae bacterium]
MPLSVGLSGREEGRWDDRDAVTAAVGVGAGGDDGGVKEVGSEAWA